MHRARPSKRILNKFDVFQGFGFVSVTWGWVGPGKPNVCWSAEVSYVTGCFLPILDGRWDSLLSGSPLVPGRLAADCSDVMLARPSNSVLRLSWGSIFNPTGYSCNRWLSSCGSSLCVAMVTLGSHDIECVYLMLWYLVHIESRRVYSWFPVQTEIKSPLSPAASPWHLPWASHVRINVDDVAFAVIQ